MTVFSGHAEQLLRSARGTNPGPAHASCAQGTHAVRPLAGATRPAGHCCASVLLGAKKPAGAGTHAAAPGLGATVPAAQSSHAPSLPLEAENVPFGHGRHVYAPSGKNFPASHT